MQVCNYKSVVIILTWAAFSNGVQWQEDALKNEGVIPEIIDSVRTYPLEVSYGDLEVTYGNLIKPAFATPAPTNLRWDFDPTKLYFLVMIDPDVISRATPLLGEINHWMIANIPGNDLTKGDILAEYITPQPGAGTGPHRYIFVVYEQPGSNTDKLALSPKYSETIPTTNFEKRINFSIKKFAKEFNLGEPVAANFFLSEYTPPRCELVY